MDLSGRPKKKKHIMALSRARYKGVILYETPLGVVFFLGMEFHARLKLADATAFIDSWIKQRSN